MARLVVNGATHRVEPGEGKTLLEALRDDLGLTGTKYGCGEGRCGACTVLLDGRPVRSCTLLLDDVDGAGVGTVEGLAARGRLHRVQQAFVTERALQCGYCTPGMVMSSVALLDEVPDPDEDTVVAALEGNICRCGGYPAILRAVRSAARGGAGPQERDVLDERREAPPTGRAQESTWTVVLPPLDGTSATGREWGWSTPGGARLSVDARGGVTAYVGKVDGGQGNRIALTRLVAAELGTPTSRVALEMGDTASSPHDLGTFGSRSTADAGHVLRLLAARARRAFVAEAAARWRVPGDRLGVRGGEVHDPHTGTVVSYADLVGAGSRRLEADWEDALPTAPDGLDEVDDAALHQRLRAAVTGAKRFPSDLAPPGMLHARLLRPPAHGAHLESVDTGGARSLPGVSVVEEDGTVAVLAKSRWAATRALHHLVAHWSPGQGPQQSSLESYLRDHPVDRAGWQGAVQDESGDVDAARAGTDLVLEATYTTAYIAHVPMEPRVAVASADGDAVTVWVGTQTPFAVRRQTAAALGVDEEQVRVVVPDFGGGFGGKHAADVAIEAARLARSSGRPVKVAWTRAEEFRHAYFRPAAVIDVRCGAQDGTWTSWEHTNLNSGAAALSPPYAVANQRVRYQPAQSPLPQGSYRALAATANNFARECHVDDLALALGEDAVALRLRHLDDERLRAVVAAVAEQVGWPRGREEEGLGAGLACGREKGARVATAAEVQVTGDRKVQVRRIVTAVDCGAVVDSSGLRNQVVGATLMGLGGALFESVNFEAGRILNAGLADYRVPRFGDVPPVDVLVLDRPDQPSTGAGETPIIAVAPAVGNAIHAATRRRLRSLPLAPGGAVPD